MGFAARDTLVTVVNTMWGAFWLAIGLLYFLVVRTCVRCFGEGGGGGGGVGGGRGEEELGDEYVEWVGDEAR